MSCNCNSSSPCGCSDVSSLPTGPAGTSAFIYAAYASDNTGTDFSLSNVNLCYKAIRTSNVQLVPVVGDFSGLWFNTCGGGGAPGTDGTNGTNGTNGTDGCDPNITITAFVEGEVNPFEVIVTQGGTACDPTYELEFPTNIFTSEIVVNTIVNTTEFTDAVLLAVETIFSTNPITGSFISISDSGTPDILYDSSGSGVLTISAPGENYYSYTKIGKLMIFNFAFEVDANSGSPDDNYNIQIKLPDSITAFNVRNYNAISFRTTNTAAPTSPYTPCVTTRSITSNSYLGLCPNGANEGTPSIGTFYIPDLNKISFRGQLIINTN